MQKQLLTAICFFTLLATNGQSVNEVLSKGLPVRKSEKIFLQKTTSNLLYDVGGTGNFKPYVDSSLFLIHKSGVNIHFQTLNPLRYSYDTATTLIADPISVDAEKAFSSIASLLTTVTGTPPGPKPGTTNGSKKKQDASKCDCLVCESLDMIVKKIVSVTGSLEDDLKERMLGSFKELRDLDFMNKSVVQAKVKEIGNDSIKFYKNHYDKIKTDIDEIQKTLASFKCQRNDSVVIKYVLTQILKDLRTSYNAKRTRLENLQKAHTIVKTVSDRTESQPVTGSVWFEDPVFINMPDDKIDILTITVNSSGMEEKDGEIVTTEKKPAFKKVLRFRRYQRFIPEVSAGVAYVNLSFPKYGTTTDAAGEQYVASAGEEKFKQLNFTAMINFVYYLENSNANPFIQVGVGTNSDYPILMTGIGLRLNTGLRRIAFSVGAASSWIKTLDKLKIGDPVSGTADIEKDLVHEFKTPKLYFGIQYNF